jgi:TonB-linked SusC/RagA family outer membrane protein
MRKLSILLALLLFTGIQLLAQRTITGKVTSADDGLGIPGVTVLIKGTTAGTLTDMDGKYSISVPKSATDLVYTYVGMKTSEVALGASNVIDVVLQSEAKVIEGVVVTALGISREKKSLGYATQDVKGDAISAVKSDNFANALSGKVTGVQIRKTTNIGGSTNVLIRGNKSITGNNQALFVIDGVPVNNDITNSNSQKQAGLGYDYGNTASDINPDDIESVNVLKGAAATALYGSRASNGVVMITTKKGTAGKGKKGIGVTINSGVTFGKVDKSTFPEYQDQYGGGYGHYYSDPLGYDPETDPAGNNAAYWYIRDVNGDGVDEQWVVTSEDASYGAPFDPNLNVYQWDAVDPQSPNFNKATPWVNAKNGPITFFETPVTYSNSLSLENSSDAYNYRFSYTNYSQKGLLPNSELKKNNLLLNANFKVTKKLTVAGSATFNKTTATGRNSTGYSDNQMGSFRQWWQTNVDLKDLENAYNTTKRNVTWNWADPTSSAPIFWDNPYWLRYENYESDARNRFIGFTSVNYELTDWVSIFGRASVDSYSGLQEERRAIGSIAAPFGIGGGADGSAGRSDQGSGYLRRDFTFSEYNYDLMLNFKKDLTTDLNLRGVLGTNVRRTNYDRVIASTNDGLGVPRIYSLQNSVGPLPYAKELASKIGVDGIYASASLGYQNFLYLDLTMRRDHASTLPVDKSSYNYPSIATSFVFSKLLKTTWLSFGKVRLNYAQVGNYADYDQLLDNYVISTPLNSPITSVPGTKKNPNLEPERTKSLEAGLEMNFFRERLGFDLAIYKTNTINQIIPLTLSTATGYNAKIINAGELENKGIELAINGTPVREKNFSWNVNVNWTANRNKVLSLLEGLDNLPLGSFQGGITLNAKVGEPYGILYGTDYTFQDGEKVVSKTSGQYIKSSTNDNIIGNVNPDWNAGMINTFTYKNWSMGFLIDMQKGGSIFSLDMYYGLATGLYKETAYTNDLGNPVRNKIVLNPDGTYASTSGGFINEGVNVAADGTATPNATRIRADRYGAFGYARGLPDIAFVYDATYVKLREVTLSYRMPSKLLEKTFIRGAEFSFVGSNLWIIFKNLPYADPESGLGAGNLQGFSTGSLPSTRDFGFNVKLNF